jgi:hypothetical protein
VASVTVAAAGAPDIDVALLEWLRAVPELRGRVQREQVALRPQQQGVSGDLVVALASTGAATALANSLQVWLTHRHTDVSVSVRGPDGREVTVTAARAHDLTQVQELLSAAVAAGGEPVPGRLTGDDAGDPEDGSSAGGHRLPAP